MIWSNDGFPFGHDEEVVFYFVVCTFSLLSSREFVSIIHDSLLLGLKIYVRISFEEGRGLCR